MARTLEQKRANAAYMREYRNGLRREPKGISLPKDYHRNWRQRNPEKTRAYMLKCVYGMSAQEYDAMFAEQGGLCAVCRRPETQAYRGVLRSLSVDHDHDTGNIRGLLCATCNAALGLVGDTAEGVRALLRYMETR